MYWVPTATLPSCICLTRTVLLMASTSFLCSTVNRMSSTKTTLLLWPPFACQLCYTVVFAAATSLIFLSRFVADAVAFLAQSPQHTVVLRCSDGFHRSCVMASALLLQLGALAPSSNADDMHLAALKFYYSQRGNPQSNEEFLTPSQIRFIKFFSDCLSAGIVTPSVRAPSHVFSPASF